MKKILVLFALLMTGVMGIHAQEDLKWGAMAGMNSSNFSTDGFDYIFRSIPVHFPAAY